MLWPAGAVACPCARRRRGRHERLGLQETGPRGFGGGVCGLHRSTTDLDLVLGMLELLSWRGAGRNQPLCGRELAFDMRERAGRLPLRGFGPRHSRLGCGHCCQVRRSRANVDQRRDQRPETITRSRSPLTGAVTT